MESVATTPIPRPVVQGIKLLALDDAAQRGYGARFTGDPLRVVAYPWPSDEPNKAIAFGICHSITTELTQGSRIELKYGTDAPPSSFELVVRFRDDPNEIQCERVKTFVDYARSFRSMFQVTPWVCLESQWLKMADFAENTQPIDIDARLLSWLSTPRSQRKAAVASDMEARQPSRGTSTLSAAIQRASANDDVLEIYAEPVDNDTLEFLRRC